MRISVLTPADLLSERKWHLESPLSQHSCPRNCDSTYWERRETDSEKGLKDLSPAIVASCSLFSLTAKELLASRKSLPQVFNSSNS